jgi:hypothetical protein
MGSHVGPLSSLLALAFAKIVDHWVLVRDLNCSAGRLGYSLGSLQTVDGVRVLLEAKLTSSSRISFLSWHEITVPLFLHSRVWQTEHF